MGFKDTVKQDIQSIFLNCDEFAEAHTVKFNGDEYKDIPVVLEVVKQSERQASASDHMEGIYSVTAKAYFDISNTDGKMPEQGKYFEIDDGEAVGETYFRRYRVVTAEDAMGMVCLELELFDE